MLQKIAIEIHCNETTLQRATAILSGDFITPDEIKKKFVERDPIVVNLDNLYDEQKAAELAILLIGFMVSADSKEDMKIAFEAILKPDMTIEDRFHKAKNFLLQKLPGHVNRYQKWVANMRKKDGENG